MEFYIGVDPGNSGAAALLDHTGGIVDTFKFKDATYRDIIDTLREWATYNEQIYAYIEKVHAMPKQGVTSVFTFGQNFGALQMALTAAGIPYEYVTPVKWMNHLNCRTKGDKNVTKALAQRRWPDKKIIHAIADCLLIAEYCRMIDKGL